MTLETGFTELPWLYAGLAAYAVATVMAFVGVIRAHALSTRIQPRGVAVKNHFESVVLASIAIGVVLIAVALAERWMRIGHGPFVNLFELLTSQLFSLGLIYTLIYWRFPVIRPAAVVVMPLMWVLGVWVLTLSAQGSPYPPTYYNDWLWFHVGFGKIFLSFCLVGTGIAGIILLRGFKISANWFNTLPDDLALDKLAWRFMLVAFVFHSLMLVAGAVWAQDAWGRYWKWDALETSSFLNWLLLGAAIHARTSYRIPLRVGAVVIFVIFIFAFLTYFGTPFFSEAAHKGVI